MPDAFQSQDVHDALRGAGTDVWEWDLDTDALSASDLGFERLGYAPGTHAQTQTAWRALIHPDDLPLHDAAYARYQHGEAPLWECVYRIRAQDGRWHHVEERGRFVAWHADGRPRRMLGIQVDVSERERLRAQADEATRQLEALAREAPGVLFQFRREADGRAWFPYLSARCESVTGLSPASLRADAAAMLGRMAPEDRAPMLASIADSAATLGPWRLQFALWRGAAERTLRGTASPRHEPGGATLWHGYLEDATELIALEDARRKVLAAEAASQAKTAFLSRISHELRTPLNAVLGFTQLLEGDTDDPPSAGQQQRLQLVRESGLHLLRMISDLLDLTRAESGQFSLQLSATALGPLARDCMAMLQPTADASGVRVSATIDEAAVGLVDTARLRQVLLNLLDNAVKYNRRGGQVRLEIAAADGGAWVRVHDDGIGIAETELPRLFDPFWRSPSARSVGEGSGIGLAVTQSLVQAMGGHIDATSRRGEGSCFSVWLPSG